jgi:Flp pilus assembly pilin Flp
MVLRTSPDDEWGRPTTQEACTPMQKLYTLLAQDDAQTMTEYATVLTVITLAALTAFTLLGAATTGAFTRVASYFS